MKLTASHCSNVIVSTDDKEDIIVALKVGKAHSQDVIFKVCLSINTFAKVCKKATTVSAHKIRNCIFITNMLANPCQPGFSTNDLFLNQLVSRSH